MRTILKKLIYGCLFSITFLAISCQDYLEKSPESIISDKDAFVNFINFQGFVEELYSCLPDPSKATWNSEFNLGDDVLSTSTATFRLNAMFDTGNYWGWQTGGGWDNSWLNDSEGANTDPNESKNKGLWPLCWYGIRKANLGLANIDNLTEATEVEKNTIKGQLLFFRGFFHFQLMSFWGGLPYIDQVLPSDQKLELPRLNYRETALKAAEDFAAAAQLLPENWDKSPVGQATLNNNNQRVTKSVAYAYLGKDLLYAASPMMNQESTGNDTYDTELCKRAAEAFTNVFKLSDNGSAYYKLQTWDKYHENFYVISGNSRIPGYPETLMAAPCYAAWQSRWSLVNMYVVPELGGETYISSPSANYVNNYGMANGLPIDDPQSGYDITHPWDNRDPRFYTDITYDGQKMVQGSISDPKEEVYRYTQLYTGGNFRNESSQSRSGYLMRKYTSPGCNKYDNEWNGIVILPPYLRLADVYLMYAEAVLQGYGTPQSSIPSFPTAAQAMNIVRNRAGVPNVADKFLTSKSAFMEQIIRERAVELSFEGLRWMDLRRWNLAGEKKYKEKTCVDFDRGLNGRIINYKERVIVTRVFESKHKWLPLPIDQVNLYPSFGQNPGW